MRALLNHFNMLLALSHLSLTFSLLWNHNTALFSTYKVTRQPLHVLTPLPCLFLPGHRHTPPTIPIHDYITLFCQQMRIPASSTSSWMSPVYDRSPPTHIIIFPTSVYYINLRKLVIYSLSSAHQCRNAPL